MKIVSRNVNGMIACRRKSFLHFWVDVKPGIVCCQEIKTQCPLNTPDYEQFLNPAQRPGYSGTLVLSRQTPFSWTTGFGIEKFDVEGRIITLEYRDYYIINVYVPSVHPHNAPERPDYRLEWDTALRGYVIRPAKACGPMRGFQCHTYLYRQLSEERKERAGQFDISIGNEGRTGTAFVRRAGRHFPSVESK